MDALDERYWDIQVNGTVVTLHLQHYLGISLITSEPSDEEAVVEIAEYLKEQREY